MHLRSLVGHVRSLMAAVALMGLLCACQSSYQLAPRLTAGQRAAQLEGRPSIVSAMAHGTVQVTLLSGPTQGPVQMLVAVRNDGEAPASFGIADVAARDGAGTLLHIYTYEQLADMARMQAYQAQVAAYRDAAKKTNAVYAGTVLEDSTGDPNSYTSTYGTGLTSSHAMPAHGADAQALDYNADAVRHQVERSATYQREVKRIESDLAGTVRKLGGMILRQANMAPGERAGGVVQVDVPKGEGAGQALTLTVSLNGETHDFLFDFKRSP